MERKTSRCHSIAHVDGGGERVGSYRSKVGEIVRPFGDLSSRLGGYGKLVVRMVDLFSLGRQS